MESPSISMETIKSKVCIVVCGMFADCSYEYMVFIVDLNSGVRESGVVSGPPTFRFSLESFELPTICVVDSKLYIFEHYHRFHKLDQPDGKTVFTYPLSGQESNIKLEKSIMRKEPAMEHTKVFPKATVTYDGKILVFSSLIEVYHSDQSDFELYDPATKKWHQLPNLPVCGPNDYRIDVESFTFIEKTVFVLRTEVGIFSLDLKSENWLWVRSGFPEIRFIPPHRGDSFVVIGREICLVPTYAYDICFVPQAVGEDVFAQLYYEFPNLSSFTKGYSSESYGITRLDNEEDQEKFNVCLLEAGVNDASMLPELMLQVYITHIPTCTKDFSINRKKKVEEDPIWWKRKREGFELPGTSKLLSLKFVAVKKCEWLNLVSFSAVRS